MKSVWVIFGLLAGTMMSANSSFATTEISTQILQKTVGSATAYVQWVSRKEIVVTVDSSYERCMVCDVIVETTKNFSTIGTFQTKVRVIVGENDVKSSLTNVPGLPQHDTAIAGMDCWIAPEVSRVPSL